MNSLNSRAGFLIRVACLTALAMLWPVRADAHKLMAYANIEDGRIHVYSYFARGNKPRGAKVTVYGKEGNVLLETKTDEKGKAIFAPPANENLRIVINSGDAHMREITVEKTRFFSASIINNASRETSPPGTGEGSQKPLVPSTDETAESEIARLNQNVSELRREVAELRMKIEAERFRDVIAGIGFIFGIAGVAAYFLSRKNAKAESPSPPAKE